MEELFNLTYKDEVEEIKDEPDFEQIGDEKYIEHEDMEARLYWAFCRPSGSHPKQIADIDPIVSIMAFNHSRLGALERFKLVHKDVIEKDNLRVKIRNRSRMLFRALVDGDFKELNDVLDLVPVFTPVAVDQLINGRKWNDIDANEIEATKFLRRCEELVNSEFFDALYMKLKNFEESDSGEIKEYLNYLFENKDSIDSVVLEHFKSETKKYLESCDLHILQKKGLEKLANKL